jgi:hypothetical protein
MVKLRLKPQRCCYLLLMLQQDSMRLIKFDVVLERTLLFPSIQYYRTHTFPIDISSDTTVTKAGHLIRFNSIPSTYSCVRRRLTCSVQAPRLQHIHVVPQRELAVNGVV